MKRYNMKMGDENNMVHNEINEGVSCMLPTYGNGGGLSGQKRRNKKIQSSEDNIVHTQ
jgi:hypothetical protein